MRNFIKCTQQNASTAAWLTMSPGIECKNTTLSLRYSLDLLCKTSKAKSGVSRSMMAHHNSTICYSWWGIIYAHIQIRCSDCDLDSLLEESFSRYWCIFWLRISRGSRFRLSKTSIKSLFEACIFRHRERNTYDFKSDVGRAPRLSVSSSSSSSPGNTADVGGRSDILAFIIDLWRSEVMFFRQQLMITMSSRQFEVQRWFWVVAMNDVM